MRPRWWQQIYNTWTRPSRKGRPLSARRWRSVGPRLESLEVRVQPDGSQGAPINFVPTAPYAEGANSQAVASADFNGDGILDLAVVNRNANNVSVRLGTGNGSFGSAMGFATAANPVAAEVGDFNGDGRVDLVVATLSEAGLSLLFGNGDGTFQPHDDQFLEASLSALDVADVDGDGKLDVAATDTQQGLIILLFGDGIGGFSGSQFFSRFVSAPTGLVFGNFDPQPEPDLAVVDSATQEVVILFNQLLLDSEGQGPPPPRLGIGQGGGRITRADFNQDGRMDLVVANKDSDDLSLILTSTNPQNPFLPEVRIPIGDQPREVLAADFSRDGKADLTVLLTGENRLVTLRGCGDGTFLPGQSQTTGQQPWTGTIGDFDGDMAPEVAFANSGSNSLSVFLNRSGVVDRLTLIGDPGTTAGAPYALEVRAIDSAGQLVPTYLGTVHFLSNDPQAVLPPDATFTLQEGGIKNVNLSLKTSGQRTIQVVDVVKTVISGQRMVSVSPGPVSTFVIGGYANPITAGTTSSFAVTPKDAFGNTVIGYEGPVHVTSSDPLATLPPDFSFNGEIGGHPDLSVTFRTAGMQSLTVTDAGNPSLTGSQGGIQVLHGAATSFEVTGAPPTTTAGVSFTITLTARDPFGNQVTGYLGTVDFTSSDPQAQLPSSYTFTSNDNGKRDFNVTLKTAGSQTVQVEDTVANLFGGTGTYVTPGSVAQLTVAGFPTSTTAGVSEAFIVTARDAYGNQVGGYRGQVEFRSSDPQADLPASYTFTDEDFGSHQFSATLKTAGIHGLTVDDLTLGVTGGQGDVEVLPATASSFMVTGFAATVAGDESSFEVTALDSFGNLDTSYIGTVEFRSSDPQAQLPLEYTFQEEDSGKQTFEATLKTAGTHTLTATQTGSSIFGSQTGITIEAAGASQFLLSPLTDVVAGEEQTVTLTIQDDFGNLAKSYTGTVRFTSDDSQSELPSEYTFVVEDAGQHSFAVTFKTSGLQSLTVEDIDAPILTATLDEIAVGAADAVSFRLDTPSTVTAGQPFDATVTAFDAFGNVATGYLGSASFTSTDLAAVLPSDVQFTEDDSGVQTVSIEFRTAGLQGLTAADASASVSGVSPSVLVEPGAATILELNGAATSVAGETASYSVTVKDAYGNIDRAYTGTIRFTSDDPQAELPSDHLFTAEDAGVFAFSVVFKTSGQRTLTLTDVDDPDLTTTRNDVRVASATAAALRVDLSSSTVAGVAFPVIVTALDPFGNIATDYTGTVRLTSTDPAAPAVQEHPFEIADGGVYTFTAELRTSGMQTISATDEASQIGGQGPAVQVFANSPAMLNLIGAMTVIAGEENFYEVQAQDAFGNVVPFYQGLVGVTSDDPQAEFPPENFVGLDGRVLILLPITLRTSGLRSVTVVDLNQPGLGGVLEGITVLSAPASQLALTSTTDLIAGGAGAVTVIALDPFGNTAFDYTGTIRFTSDDPQASLPANFTFDAAHEGRQTFPFTLRTAGEHSLTAEDLSAPSLSATQTGIQVRAAAASELVLSVPTLFVAGETAMAIVTAFDPFGNTAVGYEGTIRFTSTDPQSSLPVDFTFDASHKGTQEFAITFRTRGEHALTGSDVNAPALSATQDGIDVQSSAAVAFHLDLPTVAIAGTPVTGTLTVLDAFGNIAEGYSGTIEFTSDDPQAILPNAISFDREDAGQRSFDVTFLTTGSHTLTIQDTVKPTLSILQSVDVAPGAAAQILLDGLLSSTAGAPVTYVVTILDGLGNVATNYTGTVRLSTSDTAAIITNEIVFSPEDAGVSTFSVEFRTAGTALLTVVDDQDTLEPLESFVEVAAGEATRVALVGTVQTTAGDAISLVGFLFDAFGNVVTEYEGGFVVQVCDPAGEPSLPGIPISVSAGQFVVEVEFRTSGLQTVTVTEATRADLTASHEVVVAPAAAARLVLMSPTEGRAGDSLSMTVTALDAFGNLASLYAGIVALTSTDPQAILPSPYTFGRGDAGSHTFEIVFRSAGARSLTVTDAALAEPSVSSGDLLVRPADAASLRLEAPASVISGTPLALTATAFDAFGNIATDYAGTVRLTTPDTGARLPAEYTFQIADGGIHTFSDVVLITPMPQTITLVDVQNPSLIGTGTVLVQPVPIQDLALQLTLTPPSPLEGVEFLLAASFTPIPTRSQAVASIDWGDGSPATTVTIDPGEATFQATHRYADNRATPYPLRVTLVQGETGRGAAGLEVVVANQAPDLENSGDVALPESGFLRFNGSFADVGDDTWTLTIDYGDGSPLETQGPLAVRTFLLEHVYTQEGTYFLRVTVKDDDGASDSDLFIVEVFLPGLDDVDTETADPGETVTLTTDEVTAVLEHDDEATEDALLSLVYYDSLPLPIAPDNGQRQVLLVEDVRLTNAAPDDRLTVTFRIPPSDQSDFRLDFFDDRLGQYVPVRGSTLVADSFRVDLVARTITVVFGRTSVPAVTELRGTIFTITVSLPESRSADVRPPVAANLPILPGAFSDPTTFVSTGSRSFSLSPSEDRSLSTVQASPNSAAPSGEPANVGFAVTFAPPGTDTAHDQAAPPSVDPWPLSDDAFANWTPSWGSDAPTAPSVVPLPTDHPALLPLGTVAPVSEFGDPLSSDSPPQAASPVPERIEQISEALGSPNPGLASTESWLSGRRLGSLAMSLLGLSLIAKRTETRPKRGARVGAFKRIV